MKTHLRRPEYYIIASNVQLSAAAADSKGKGELAVTQEIISNAGLSTAQFELQSVQSTMSDLVRRLCTIPRIQWGLTGKLISNFNEFPQRRYLLVLISGSLSFYPPKMVEIDKLDHTAFSYQDGDTDLIREAIALLRLTRGDDVNLREIKTVSITRLRRILDHGRLSRDRVRETLRGVSYRRLTEPATEHSDAESCYQVLLEMVEKSKSELDNPVVYRELKLPDAI